MPRWRDAGALPSWATDATNPCQTISEVLVEQAQQYLLTVSASSIAGSAAFIWFADRLPRRRWLTTSFLVLAFLFIAAGAVYYGVAHTSAAPATVALVAVCHFAFNFGANTLTFLLPAEVFPTCYRCTCHGISAAAGKVGSLVAVLVVYGINTSYSSSTRQGLIFVLFGSVLLLGAVYSWAYLPDPQRRRPGGGFESKTLEELGGGRERARVEGEVITVREKVREIRRRRRERGRTTDFGGGGGGGGPQPGRIEPQGVDNEYQQYQRQHHHHYYNGDHVTPSTLRDNGGDDNVRGIGVNGGGQLHVGEQQQQQQQQQQGVDVYAEDGARDPRWVNRNGSELSGA